MMFFLIFCPAALRNGTRLICKSFQHNVIDTEIAVGQHAGKRVFLPKIPLTPSDDDMFPFKLKRKQFPVRLCFAITINKAQGKTIPYIGPVAFPFYPSIVNDGLQQRKKSSYPTSQATTLNLS
ncbi:hypothetical protein LXL04_016044 [Taraxacum kok-saghyz]